MSHMASNLTANMEEIEDISNNNYIEYINSEGEPISKRFSVSKNRTSRLGAEIPFDDFSNIKNVSKFINSSNQNNNKNDISNDDIIDKSKNSIKNSFNKSINENITGKNNYIVNAESINIVKTEDTNNTKANNAKNFSINSENKNLKYINNNFFANFNEEIIHTIANKITKKFENKFLSLESRNSIFYNPENNKTTAYLNINKNDLTDLNDSKNQIIFFGIKDINSKDYFVKPRLSTKKNINSFLNADSSINYSNNSKVNTESNISDLNISASNVSGLNNNFNNNNNFNERKSIRSHSNYPDFVPDYKAYSIEKSLNILIFDKQKTEAQSVNKWAENVEDFKRFRNLNVRKVHANLFIYYFDS